MNKNVLRHICIVFLGIACCVSVGCDSISSTGNTLARTGQNMHIEDKQSASCVRILHDSESGNAKDVEAALNAEGNANCTQQNGWTALMLATNNEHLSVVKCLLAHGAAPRRRSKLYNDVDALKLAAESGNIPITKLLLEHGANINEMDDVGSTPLMGAAGQTNITPAREYRMVQFLIQHGANAAVMDHEGNTALSIAMNLLREEPEFAKTVQLLQKSDTRNIGGDSIDHNAAMHSKNTKEPSPTMAAISNKIFYREQLLEDASVGNLNGVQLDIKGGADINATQQNGWTALMLATNNGHLSVVKCLLAHGADPRRRSKLYNDVDALELAAESGNIPITSLLLEHGADINETDDVGNTPLMGIVGNGDVPLPKVYKMVLFLIQHRADVTVTGSTGETSLSIIEGRIKIAAYLKETRAMIPELVSIKHLLLSANARKANHM